MIPTRAIAWIATALLTCTQLPAGDPPHDSSKSIQCTSCHKPHSAVGGSLTLVAGNANLCLSCHVSGGSATTKAMVSADQALPPGGLPTGVSASGTSHRWDSSPAGRVARSTPNTSTGTITPSGAYTGAYPVTIQIKISTGGQTGVAKFDWQQTQNGGATYGTATTAVATSSTPQALGTTGISVAFADGGTNPSFVLNDVFLLYARPDLRAPVTAALSQRLENGRLMCSTCHDQHLQANKPFDPAASATYSPGVTNNRHFQRIANDTGQMCVDCHNPRNVTASGGTSHPIAVTLPATNFKAPVSALLDTTSKVQCLTCHRVHPPFPTGTASPTTDGTLLRTANTASALCKDCHTLADTTTANVHTNPTTGIVWAGDQYGGSTYPALTTADRGNCKNCHTPHGWPDGAGSHYSKLLGARQDYLCTSCHDGSPSTKDVRTPIISAIRHPVERTSGRTVACGDCHNPHMASAGIHTATGGQPTTTQGTANGNRIRDALGTTFYSRALRGVDGLTFNYSGLAKWATPPTATGAANTWFTKFASGSPSVAASGAEFEYQICFKCHTSYSFLLSAPPDGITTGGTTSLTLASGSLQSVWTTGAGTGVFTTTAVTGTGTTWATAGTNLLAPGMFIRRGTTTGTGYRITGVTSNTALVITGGATGTSSTYQTRPTASFAASTTVTVYATNWTPPVVGQFIDLSANGTGGNAYRITAVTPVGTPVTSYTLTIASNATASTYTDFYLHPGASFTNGSTAVTGYGTNWTSALVGQGIQANTQAGTYVISAVNSTTSLTLASAYTNTTGTYRYLTGTVPGPLKQTDVAQEFNPANGSYHPVVASLAAGTGKGSTPLAAGQMVAPWTAVGTQTMTCSDCHGNSAAAPAAQGPHGSAVQFMLKGTNTGWPDVGTAGAWGASFCVNCHASATNTGGTVNVHTNQGAHNIPCYRCHIVVPHGGKVARLMGTNTAGMPTRYAYQNTLSTTYLRAFVKASSASYAESNCGSAQSGCTNHSLASSTTNSW